MLQRVVKKPTLLVGSFCPRHRPWAAWHSGCLGCVWGCIGGSLTQWCVVNMADLALDGGASKCD